MINVLDHGHVRLVDSMGDDLSIVRNARVSYDAEWRAGEDKGGDERLINYLYKNHHNTPFESVTFTFDVKAPIFVLRQWHRHRTQSYNELSARYRELPAEFYVPELEQITTQSTDNKQMRTDEVHPHAVEIQNAIAQKCAVHIRNQMMRGDQNLLGLMKASKFVNEGSNEDAQEAITNNVDTEIDETVEDHQIPKSMKDIYR